LTPAGDAEAWMAGQREFWEAGFDRLADRLDRISAEDAHDGATGGR